jgi:hypothetical protein
MGNVKINKIKASLAKFRIRILVVCSAYLTSLGVSRGKILFYLHIAVFALTTESRIEQGKKLLEMTTKVLLVSLKFGCIQFSYLTCYRQTNVQVFQVVLDIQKIITRIPGQVDQQQPVYLIDALGKSSSFHLEFVRSAEASHPADTDSCALLKI